MRKNHFNRWFFMNTACRNHLHYWRSFACGNNRQFLQSLVYWQVTKSYGTTGPACKNVFHISGCLVSAKRIVACAAYDIIGSTHADLIWVHYVDHESLYIWSNQSERKRKPSRATNQTKSKYKSMSLDS